jgi:hypothetical protein
MRQCVLNSLVIPGRREAASPESITIIVSMDSGLAPKRARPGMTISEGYAGLTPTPFRSQNPFPPAAKRSMVPDGPAVGDGRIIK